MKLDTGSVLIGIALGAGAAIVAWFAALLVTAAEDEYYERSTHDYTAGPDMAWADPDEVWGA